MKKIKLLLCFSFLFISFSFTKAQGVWTKLTNPAPDSNASGMILLTDGTVMCKTSAGGADLNGDRWNLLTPDIHGNYANGTWSVLPPMHGTRLWFSTQMMPDGNAYVAGGEDGSGDSTAEIFNTLTKTWTRVNMSGVPANWVIADANSELLYDGTILEAPQYTPEWYITMLSHHNLLYHPATNSFDTAMPCFGSHYESTWIKLRDSSVLFVDEPAQTSERYVPKMKKWVKDANVPDSLYFNEETGPALLLPDGRAFFTGGYRYTAFYIPSGDTSKGTWTRGPDMPDSSITGQLGAADSPDAIMPDGNILCYLSEAEFGPCYFYEFNYLTNKFKLIKEPGGSDSCKANSFNITLLNLPDGNLLVAMRDSTSYYIYTPSGNPIASGKPTIDNIDKTNCPNYRITGKLFNGLSEGSAFGDDWQMATNYPIIRLTDGTNVYYARTFNWNRIGAVMTDSLEDTAYFTVPYTVPPGTYSLVVTANGNPSNPVLFTPCVSGIAEIKEPNSISVFPNPFSSYTTISIHYSLSTSHYLELDDITGRTLKHLEFTGNAYTLSAEGLAKGMYFIRVFDGDYHLLGVSKIVVQ